MKKVVALIISCLLIINLFGNGLIVEAIDLLEETTIVNIGHGETYEFTNNTDDMINFTFNESAYLDIVEYDNSNDCVNCIYFNYDTSIIKIGSNKTVKFTCADEDGAEIKIPEFCVDKIQKLENKALVQYTLEANRKYEFNNNSSTKLNLTVSNLTDTYISLDELEYGLLSVEKFNKYSVYTIDKGTKVKFSKEEGKSDILYLPYEFKDCIKEITDDYYKKVTIQNGEIIDFKNLSNKFLKFYVSDSNDEAILHYGLAYDVNDKENINKVYKEFGDSVVDVKNKKLSAVNSESMIIYMPSEVDGQYEITQGKLLEEINLLPGYAYELKNDIQKSYNYFNYSISPDSSISALKYNYKGEIVDLRCGEGSSDKLFGRQVIKFKITDEKNRTLLVPYEYRNNLSEAEGNPVQKDILNNNETRTYTNEEEETKFIRVIPSDYCAYSFKYKMKDGSIQEGDGSYSRTFQIEKGEELMIRANVSNLVVAVPNYTVKYRYRREDINLDNKVDTTDISIIANEYNTYEGNNKKYDRRCDLDYNKNTDMYDLVKVAKSIL